MQSLRQQRFGEQDQNSLMNGNDRQSIVDSERSLERNVEIVNAFIELCDVTRVKTTSSVLFTELVLLWLAERKIKVY